LASTLAAFLIPKSYTSTAQLMPPDQQSTSALAMMAGMAGMAAKSGGGLGAMAGDLLGIKSSGALFVGVLKSQTAQDRLVEKFDLRKVYGKRLVMDARSKLDENTSISEDRKSGIISISVTDHSPQRAAALANAERHHQHQRNRSQSAARRSAGQCLRRRAEFVGGTAVDLLSAQRARIPRSALESCETGLRRSREPACAVF